ncbi:hypothetical protein CYMTET_34447 [Cymbomonas tetramitiformis]|uniref:Uncharacterized protein n=1 Tax=Cymbomonas tetramitiformis TaxID=36881 RepID=A0AAE0FB53_9CHLO|nr:hypothetical protein CYMTET_34447 [Cymbomonas tetramitiformis]
MDFEMLERMTHGSFVDLRRWIRESLPSAYQVPSWAVILILLPLIGKTSREHSGERRAICVHSFFKVTITAYAVNRLWSRLVSTRSQLLEMDRLLENLQNTSGLEVLRFATM